MRGKFAKAVPGDKIGTHAFFFQHAIGCHGDRQNCGLGIGGQFQRIFAPRQTQVRNRKSQSLVRLGEHTSGCRIVIGELFAHAQVL